MRPRFRPRASQGTDPEIPATAGAVRVGFVVRIVTIRTVRVERRKKPPLRCVKCGGPMQLLAITDGSGRLLYNHPLPYLDSG